MFSAGKITSGDLPLEVFVKWTQWDPPPVDLKTFHLGTEEHRQDFLYQYQWQGDDVLFTAIAHIWDSLEGEREAHCILVGLLSGTGGKGKTALRKTLQKFLAECLDTPTPAMPRMADFASMDEWNAAVRSGWNNDEAHVLKLCQQYSAILDGRSSEWTALDRECEPSNLLLGPWR